MVDGLRAEFQGRLGADATLRYTQQGKALLQFSAIVSDSRAPEGTPAQWIKISLFGEQAEELAPKLTKGTEVYAAGKLSVSEWQASDGLLRHGLQLLVWTVQPMGTIGRRRPEAVRHGGLVDPAEAA